MWPINCPIPDFVIRASCTLVFVSVCAGMHVYLYVKARVAVWVGVVWVCVYVWWCECVNTCECYMPSTSHLACLHYYISLRLCVCFCVNMFVCMTLCVCGRTCVRVCTCTPGHPGVLEFRFEPCELIWPQAAECPHLYYWLITWFPRRGDTLWPLESRQAASVGCPLITVITWLSYLMSPWLELECNSAVDPDGRRVFTSETLHLFSRLMRSCRTVMTWLSRSLFGVYFPKLFKSAEVQ